MEDLSTREAVKEAFPGGAMTSEDLMPAAKWHGSIIVIIAAPLDKAWALQSDFCGINKWIPTMDSCEMVEGEDRKPGCLRYAVGHSFPREGGGETWAKERLLMIDDENHCLSYAMEDSCFGFEGYIAKVQLKDAGEGRTKVDWSFEVNPVTNFTEEKLVAYMTSVYKTTLAHLEQAAAFSPRTTTSAPCPSIPNVHPNH